MKRFIGRSRKEDIISKVGWVREDAVIEERRGYSLIGLRPRRRE
jgi:hypothetical protein